MSQKPIILHTWTTPNGYAISIYLEELKATYPGFDYEYVPLQELVCAYLTVYTELER